jgi:YfiH family protein
MEYHARNLETIKHISHSFDSANNRSLPSGLIICNQVNGAHIVEARPGCNSGTWEADAIFTTNATPIGIVTADCLPLLIGSHHQRFAAAIHAGWKGLRANIIDNSFQAFRQAGIAIEDLRVAIGPSIQSCCYEVELSLISGIDAVHGHLWRNKSPPWSTHHNVLKCNPELPVAKPSHGEAWLDLSKYCTYLLEAANIKPWQVEKIDACTYCSNKNLGSYRRRSHYSEIKKFQYSWICLNDS